MDQDHNTDVLDQDLIQKNKISNRLSSSATALTEDEKKKMLFCILISNMICGTMILNISSFYPLFVEINYGDYITPSMTAFALGCF